MTDRGQGRLSERIFFPRWMLFGFYVFLVALATATVIRGSATLDLTQPDSYTPIWSAAVGGGALIAAAATAFRVLSGVEKWAAAWMAGWLAFLAYEAFRVAHGSGWLIVALFAALVFARSVALFSRRTT
jgi:hypothetical protein